MGWGWVPTLKQLTPAALYSVIDSKNERQPLRLWRTCVALEFGFFPSRFTCRLSLPDVRSRYERVLRQTIPFKLVAFNPEPSSQLAPYLHTSCELTFIQHIQPIDKGRLPQGPRAVLRPVPRQRRHLINSRHLKAPSLSSAQGSSQAGIQCPWRINRGIWW